MRAKYFDYIESAEAGAIRFDGLDSAIIGLDADGFLIYDFDMLVTALMQQGMTSEEAIEWIDFNIVPINAGNAFTILYR